MPGSTEMEILGSSRDPLGRRFFPEKRPEPVSAPGPLSTILPAPTLSGRLGEVGSFVEPHSYLSGASEPAGQQSRKGCCRSLQLPVPPAPATCLLPPPPSPNRPELPPLVTQRSRVYAAFPEQSERQLKACKAFAHPPGPVGSCRNSRGYRPSLSIRKGVE